MELLQFLLLLLGQVLLNEGVHVSNQILNVSLGLSHLDLVVVKCALRDALEFSFEHLVLVKVDQLHELDLVNFFFINVEVLVRSDLEGEWNLVDQVEDQRPSGLLLRLVLSTSQEHADDLEHLRLYLGEGLFHFLAVVEGVSWGVRVLT